MYSRFVVYSAVVLIAIAAGCGSDVQDSPTVDPNAVVASPVGSPTATPVDVVETHPLTMIPPEIPFRVEMEPTAAAPASEFLFERRTDSFPVGGGRPFVEIKWNVPLPVATSEQQALAKLLSRIPDTPENRGGLLHLTDLELWRSLIGLDVPSYEDGKGAYWESMVAVLESQSSAPPSPLFYGPGKVPQHVENSSSSEDLNTFGSLGFDRRNVDQTAMYGLRSGISGAFVEVTQGRFDPVLSKMLLTECECPQPDAVVSYGGYEYWSWDEEYKLQRRNSPPVFDRFGRGGHVLITEFGLWRTSSSLLMEQVIDTLGGVHASLGASGDYAFMVDVMSANEVNDLRVFGRDVLSREEVLPDGDGPISRGGVTTGPIYTISKESNRANALLAPPLLPYRFAATSYSSSDAGQFYFVVIANDSPEDALENAHRLADRVVHSNTEDGLPWAVVFTAVEISVSGNNVVARFTASGANHLLQIDHSSLLLVHEG